MLSFQQHNKKFDLEKAQKMIEKSFMLAAQRTGSMRGVFQGDMLAVVNAEQIKKAA